MSEKMESLRKNSIWELVLKPKDQKIIDSKWIYRKKESINEKKNSNLQGKLVANVLSQKERIDYDEIFSPIIKYISIRVLLSLVA